MSLKMWVGKIGNEKITKILYCIVANLATIRLKYIFVVSKLYSTNYSFIRMIGNGGTQFKTFTTL